MEGKEMVGTVYERRRDAEYKRTAPKRRVIEMHKLERDLDGYVHTPHGFMSAQAYRDIQAANAGLLPRYEDIPVM